MNTKQNQAFTIVELLIVIVVIAILAAITIVAYNGIQARAYNAATISQAKQTIDLINAYIAVEGKYPSTSNGCATRDSQCTWLDGAVNSNNNATLMNNLSTIGSPAASRVSGSVAGKYYGLTYSYTTANRTWNGVTQPLLLMYFLKGVNQSCGVSNVMNNSGQAVPADNNYTGNIATDNMTFCYIHIDGPTS